MPCARSPAAAPSPAVCIFCVFFRIIIIIIRSSLCGCAPPPPPKSFNVDRRAPGPKRPGARRVTAAYTGYPSGHCGCTAVSVTRFRLTVIIARTRRSPVHPYAFAPARARLICRKDLRNDRCRARLKAKNIKKKTTTNFNHRIYYYTRPTPPIVGRPETPSRSRDTDTDFGFVVSPFFNTRLQFRSDKSLKNRSTLIIRY